MARSSFYALVHRFRGIEALGFAVVAAAIAVGSFAGCGGSRRPPPPSDEQGGGDDDAGAGGGFDFDARPVPPSCDQARPDGSICACIDEPLLIDPPNVYFVLDRSGSMNEPMGSGGKSKWSAVRATLEQIVVALGPRAKFGAAVFPDPKFDSCAKGSEVFALARGDAPAGQAGPTAKSLAAALSKIAAFGGTPTAATLSSIAPHIESFGGKTYVILATDGGPNCNASASCNASGCEFNIESANGCTPVGPNCCVAPNGNNLSCLDAQPTIDAVTALAKAGIPTYVLGVPGSAPYATLLDQLAQAGGTARASEPRYYAVSDETALQSALSKIAAKITGTCTLDLNQPPPDPSLVNVFLDERVLPQEGPDGWALQGSSVTILGASCQSILDGDVLDVRVVAGCPTVIR